MFCKISDSEQPHAVLDASGPDHMRRGTLSGMHIFADLGMTCCQHVSVSVEFVAQAADKKIFLDSFVWRPFGHAVVLRSRNIFENSMS